MYKVSSPPGRFYTPIEEAVDPSLYEYNSNYTVPVYNEVGPKPFAQRYMDELEFNYAGAKRVNDTYLGRAESSAAVLAAEDKKIIQFAVQEDPKPFPGYVPRLKDVKDNDFAIPMKESFSMSTPLSDSMDYERERRRERGGSSHRTQTCIDFLNHVRSCPLCRRYFECDNRIFYVIIFMLILIFAVILYFVTKDCSSTSLPKYSVHTTHR
jgi:hypothetical protein